jgi:hypothetical protein
VVIILQSKIITLRQHHGPRQFRCGARVLRVSECFDAYWQFAAERQRIFHCQAAGVPPP